MLERNHGHIVTVASSLGLFTTAGVEVKKKKKILICSVMYCVAKMLLKFSNPLISPLCCRTIVQASLEP